MEDNGRVYKDAYRTCRREYDSLAKKFSSGKGGYTVRSLIKWMLPVLGVVAAAFAAVWFLAPGARHYALKVFCCLEGGLAISFLIFLAYKLIAGKSGSDSRRMERLEGILEELDEAWLAHDANEAAKRRISEERLGRQQLGQYSVRERVFSNSQNVSADEGEEL